MSELLPFIVAGLATGAIYGLAAVGLVLTYKTSGVFNLAHGALATLAAYVFYSLFVSEGWSWPAAAAVAVLVLGPAMGLVLELLMRRISRRTLVWQVAATVGLMLVITGGIELIYGTAQQRSVPVFLGSSTVDLGTNVQWSSIVTFLFAVAATIALGVFFRTARLGLAMRAVVDSPELLSVAGTSPTRVRRSAWVIGATFAAASGVLLAAILPLDPVNLTLLVVAAFGAAALGAFTSIPASFAGGLLIGVLASLSTKWFPTGLLAGIPPSLPFIVLFVVLLVFPRRYLVSRSDPLPIARPQWTAPTPVQIGGGVVLLAILAFVPSFVGIHLTDWTTGVAAALLFLSLGLLVRTSGQVSLAHVAFAAIGAVAFSHLAVDQGIPWLAALVLAGLVAVPIGALLAIPAIRLTGLYLALATFGFGILVQQMFYTQSFMFGDFGVGLQMPRPGEVLGVDLSGDRAYYYLVLGFVTLATISLVALNRSRLGRLLRGLSDSPTALQTSGTAINVTRVLVFCLSAFMAAVAGALMGISLTTISAEAYPPLLSLTYFALIMIVPGRMPWDAIVAGLALIVLPSYISGETVTTVLQVLFGATALLYAIEPSVRELPPAARRAIDTVFRRARSTAHTAPTVPAAAANPVGRVRPGELEVQRLGVRFGGLRAVDDVSMRAPTGRITGLIGPNGAGKTTTFNACTGLGARTGGRILLDGRDISRLGPAARARKGLGRTFQKMELLDSLTVAENVAIGAEGSLAGAYPLRHVVPRRGESATVQAATAHALEQCELIDLADVPTANLSTGQRRLVELARCLAGPFRILLLDEPSSGLDTAETARFGRILQRVVADRDVGILLVEHDMSLALGVCEHVYVLDFGRLVFEGAPAEIAASPIVQAAYLGDALVESAATVADEVAS